MSGFPENLPPRPESSWASRHCPGMRFCWPFRWDDWTLHTSNKAVLVRRICMWVTLGIRTALSVLSIARNAWGGFVTSVIVGSILGVLGFFFIAWCLATIGQAQGKRKVLSLTIGRWHFDIFLLVCALIHLALLISNFFGLAPVGLSSSWLVMWLLIFLVAWIATWEPDQSDIQV